MARIIADGLGNRKFGEHSRDERETESDFTPAAGASLLAQVPSTIEYPKVKPGKKG
jgi:hypothetical protein